MKTNIKLTDHRFFYNIEFSNHENFINQNQIKREISAILGGIVPW